MKDELVKKLLKGAGYPDSLFADSEKEDFKADEVIENLNFSNKKHYEDLLTDEIKSKVTDEVTQGRDGALYDHIHRAMKKSGMDIEPIKEMQITDKVKEYEKFLKGKYSVNKDEGKLKKEFDELQQKHLDLENSIGDKEKEWEDKYAEVEKTAHARALQKEVDLNLHKHFQTIPDNRLVGGKHADGFYKAVKSVVDGKYDTSIDETGNVVFLEKGTQTRAKGKKEGREEFLGVDDVVRNELKGLSLWVESNGNGEKEQKKDQRTEDTSGQQKEKSARLIQMEQEIAAQRAES